MVESVLEIGKNVWVRTCQKAINNAVFKDGAQSFKMQRGDKDTPMSAEMMAYITEYLLDFAKDARKVIDELGIVPVTIRTTSYGATVPRIPDWKNDTIRVFYDEKTDTQTYKYYRASRPNEEDTDVAILDGTSAPPRPSAARAPLTVW